MVVDLSLGKILLLAGADAVNPCALAVLALVLIAILTASRRKINVLKAGFAFTLSVYVLYFLYALIIIGFFKGMHLLFSQVSIYLFKALGAFAMIIGLFNIKDAIWYKAGGFMTEMPLFMRPKLKRLISRIISPSGAFLIGIFVTLFLLPCTIGPLFVASGILSTIDLLAAVPWLLLYNVVFVSPMIAITFIIFLGYSTVEQVGGWKEKNIRYLHLIAGLILFGLGIGMIMGWL